MKRMVMSVTVVLLACAGIFSTSSAADPFVATLQAHSNLNGTFPSPNPRNFDSGVVSCKSVDQTVKEGDKFTYTFPPPNSSTVYANQNAAVQTGTIRLYQYLSAEGLMAGLTGVLTGTFIDQFTIVSGKELGNLKLTVQPSGNCYDSAGTYSGNINLDITFLNSGSASSPKNLKYHFRQEIAWGPGGVTNNASGPKDTPIYPGDVITLTVEVVLTDSVLAHGDSAHVTADFSHTIHVYVDSTVPGFALTTASGHDYRTPKGSAADIPWALYE